MKKSRFSEEQIVRILNEVGSGKSVREVCRAHGVSENSYYVWKRKYGGMDTDDVRRLKELEAENAALKRIVANQAIELEATGKLLRKMGFGLRAAVGGRVLEVGWTLRAKGLPAHAAAAIGGEGGRDDQLIEWRRDQML